MAAILFSDSWVAGKEKALEAVVIREAGVA